MVHAGKTRFLLLDMQNSECEDFGLLTYIHSYVFDWDNVSFNDGTGTCPEWKATIAFAFLSAICWLVSAILGYVSRFLLSLSTGTGIGKESRSRRLLTGNL